MNRAGTEERNGEAGETDRNKTKRNREDEEGRNGRKKYRGTKGGREARRDGAGRFEMGLRGPWDRDWMSVKLPASNPTKFATLNLIHKNGF